MKRLLLIAFAIAAPAHGQSAGTPASTEQRAALQSYYTCLYQQAGAADDGVAEPMTVARKIAPSCRYLLGAAATLFSRGKPPAERDDLYRKFLGLEDRQVTKVVEAVRRERLTDAVSAMPTSSSEKPVAVETTASNTVAAKPAAAKPKPKPKPVAKPAANAKPMSEWRRAYIAKHGHEPPVAAK